MESEPESLAKAYEETRALSEGIYETLVPEDCVVQTMPEVSPTKWRLARTSWFFELLFEKFVICHEVSLGVSA